MAYTRGQLEKRINEAGAGRYEFVRWVVDGEYGTLKKCVVRCLVDNYEWESSVNNLVNTVRGCPHCAGKRRWTAEERIEQINKLENIEFVSWVDGYKNCYSKANVNCKIDSFSWSPTINDIINGGYGCPKCAREFVGGIKRLPPESYIERLPNGVKFIKWHDKYKCAKSLMIVSCENMHIWKVRANNIIHGMQGCPYCAKYGYQLDKKGYLYALRSECGQYVKVGISNKPKRRHKELEKITPFTFSFIEQISGDGDKIRDLEKYFHNKYERAGFTGFSGATEWLVCTTRLLKELSELENVK